MEVSGGGSGVQRRRQAQITCIMILCFYFRRFFFSPLVSMLLQSASNRDVFWTPEPIVFLLTAAWSLRESWWLCTILANCHGADGGRGTGGSGGECFPHRNRANVIEHIVFKYKVDLSEGDSGQQWWEPLSPHLFFVLCHCLCEAGALNGWTRGRICEVRKWQPLFTVRESEVYKGIRRKN